jgi:hypothetical protein
MCGRTLAICHRTVEIWAYFSLSSHDGEGNMGIFLEMSNGILEL